MRDWEFVFIWMGDGVFFKGVGPGRSAMFKWKATLIMSTQVALRIFLFFYFIFQDGFFL